MIVIDRRHIVIGVIVCILALILGIIIGYFSAKPDAVAAVSDVCTPSSKEVCVIKAFMADKDDMDKTEKTLLDGIKASNIRTYLKRLSSKPHVAGQEGSTQVTDYLSKFYKDQGFDSVQKLKYDVIVSYPKKQAEKFQSSFVRAYFNNNEKFSSSGLEPAINPEDNDPNMLPPYNGYSKSGSFESSNLYYVNYAREEDFQTMFKAEPKLREQIKGKFLLARYGKIFRGTKGDLAQKYGAKGLILYNDPADYGPPKGVLPFPNSTFMSDQGIQRGTLYSSSGDPDTPGYPSVESAFRNETYRDIILPSLSVLPIQAKEAYHFLNAMSEGVSITDKNSTWKGSLNVTYKIGAHFPSEWKIKMEVNTENVKVTSYDVISLIEGSVEPDRYVIFGNHHDAWGFGAIDPSSGTAGLMAIGASLGTLKKTGWRPRRSILICHWGSEEYGLIGSTEFVENYRSILNERTVAYINLDIAVYGTFRPEGKGHAMFTDLLYSAAKKVENPNSTDVAQGLKTVYDKWLATSKTSKSLNDGNEAQAGPTLKLLGSGSDFAPFSFTLGVPCLEFSYTYDDDSYDYGKYSLYHSRYETFYLIDKVYRNYFKFDERVSQVLASVGYQLSNRIILPFNVSRYGVQMQTFVKQIRDQHGGSFAKNNLNDQFDFLKNAVTTFQSQCDKLQGAIGKSESYENPFKLRLINDQLMQLERMFIDPLGLPGRLFMRNVISAPSIFDSYSGSAFPGLVDTLSDNQTASGGDGIDWPLVQKQLSVITYFISMATDSLKSVTKFFV